MNPLRRRAVRAPEPALAVPVPVLAPGPPTPQEVTGPVSYHQLAQLAQQEAPPSDLYDFDAEDAQERQKRVLMLLAAGKMRADITRAIQKEFLVDTHTAGNDYVAATRRVRDHLDDEGSIDTVMYSAMGRMHDMGTRFYQIAMQPIPEQVLDVLGPNPDDPLDGAVYRPLKPAERSQEVAARAQAAKVAISAQQTLTSIVGRRSQRWADKPAVVAVQINNSVGLSPEDQALLEKLKMAVG